MFSMNKPNDRRLAVLSFIRDRVAADGRPPSLAEIAEACGFASRSAVRKHVMALQASGQLDATPGKARSARPKVSRKVVVTNANSFFEVSSEHIAALSDTDFRELVARLCIARLVSKGHSSDYVIWGGDQRAADGGIDVRVQMPARVAASAEFSRALVGFQAKTTRMPESDIRKEMCPGGVLRASIRELIRGAGAYVIASSETVADKPFRDRVAAMKEAAAMEAGAENAEFDFYDARRLANWTNQHPGIVAWVRSRLGLALQGWRPYGQWAITRGAKSHPFLDDTSRLVDPAAPERKYSLADGLQHVRALLRNGGSSIRIAGLSGVGKTRFVQALFEEQAASGAIASELAVYTDTAESPVPSPIALLDELLANNRRAVLVVDNCASQLHRQLTARCKATDRVSLLTIEYDIREDSPDETNVFLLEPGSEELIEKVIGQQFPHISKVNVATICRFSKGNSRVAIALANTLEQNDSLAGINDEGLLERLFWQGRQVEPDLMVVAQTCALVYSFQVEDPDEELQLLAGLAGIPALTFYRHVGELLQRGLAQKRGSWRAILPHAIANTLASRALSKTPYSAVSSALVEGRGRLLRSLSRRLGYLHDSPEAVGVVHRWFEDKNLLADLTRLAPPLDEVLQNIAPVDPEITLQAIERAATGERALEFLSVENFVRRRIVQLLRAIAWEAKYFERCLRVLIQFALAELEEGRSESTREIIKSLFTIYLSGTHATLEQRFAWIRDALRSKDPRIQRIGIQCLDAALQATHISSSHSFEFGARSRDYGAYPRGIEVRDWFSRFADLATDVGLQENEVGNQARNVLASHFRSLWASVGIVEALEQATSRLLQVGWERGWLAIKQTIRFDIAGMPETIQGRLRALEELSRPQTLVGRTKAVVLNSFSGGLDITDAEEHGVAAYERADQLARDLGEMVVVEPQVFAELLPLLVQNHQGRHRMFGIGMAKGAPDPARIWHMLVTAFEETSFDLRNVQVLCGFLQGLHERDQALFEQLMDAAMSRPSLAIWIPVLQLSGDLDVRGCARLLQSMDDPLVPASMFQYLGYGRATEALSDDALSQLLERLARKPGGLEVAIDVLSMHCYGNSAPAGPALIRLAHELLSQFSPTRDSQNIDFALGGVIRKLLLGKEGEACARLLLRKVRRGFDDYSLSHYAVGDVLAALFEVQPMAALDELVGDEADEGKHSTRWWHLRDDDAKSVLTGVPIDILIGWCRAGSGSRWERVAAAIPAFDKMNGKDDSCWSKSALALLSSAPEPVRVASVLAERIEPMSWHGSRAEIIAGRASLLDELAEVLGDDAADDVREWRNNLQERIDIERRRELQEHRRDNERFE